MKEPGLLIVLERKETALRGEAEMLRRNAAEADRARAELSVLAGERTRLAEEFAAKKFLLESNRDILQMEQRLSALKENERLRERKVRQIQEYTTKLVRLDRDLETTTASGIPGEEAVTHGRSLQERLRARERDLGALTTEEGAAEGTAGSARRGEQDAGDRE